MTAPGIDRGLILHLVCASVRVAGHALVPEPSCTTRKPVKFAVALRGHLPNITLCTTRNSYSCYTLKVPRRQPDPLRLCSHFSRNSAPGVCGRPQLKRRPAMPARNGRLAAPPLAGAGRRQTIKRAGDRPARAWNHEGHFVAIRLGAPPPVQDVFPKSFAIRGSRTRFRELFADRIPHAARGEQRLPGEPIAAAGADRIGALRSKRNW